MRHAGAALAATLASAMALGAGLSACTGSLGDVEDGAADGADGADGGAGGKGTATSPSCDTTRVGPSPLRRLTRWEYNNTVHDLLGDETRPADRFEPEAEQLGFDNNVEGATMSDIVVEQYENAARALAATAVADLPGLLGCEAEEEGCLEAFLDDFGTRAFRRPLGEEERAKHLGFLTSSVEEDGATEGVALWISAVLQSPSFLTRVELGTAQAPDEAGLVPLSPHEVASRLSYLLWGSMPDDALFAAAEADELRTPEQLLAQVDRMFADEKGGRAIRNFYGQWIGLGNLDRIQRGDELDAPTRALLREEIERFAEEVLLREGGGLEAFFTTPRTYLNAELADFYGVEGEFDETFRAVDLPADRHAGFFTKGATMALLAHPEQSSPVLRGKFVMEKVFCQGPPPPPCDVDTSLPAVDPDATAREQLEQKTSAPQCAACHSFLNPPGFAFEHFDQLGRWRDEDRDLPIDASGVLQTTDVDGPFDDHVGLAARIATSEAARSCMVLHWFHYAFGRVEGDDDACTLETVTHDFEEGGGDVRVLLRSLVTSPSFVLRTAGGAP